MKRCLLLLLLALLASVARAQDRPKLIGEVEFFGYAGVDTNRLRAELPFHEQDRFVWETFEGQLEAIFNAVKRVAGRDPTDLNNVCCDERGDQVIFIGLAGKPASYNPPPKGRARLPDKILDLYDRYLELIFESVQRGAADEDASKGYALASYPPLRSVQLQMRAYAVGHGAQIREVLETAAGERQRIAAAALLGYTRQSRSQLAALVRASRDSSDGVRNNATRALIVLARSSPRVAGSIPAAGFIDLLLSGKWTDLNKSSNLLQFITTSRNKELLKRLSRPEVVERLIEIARWRSHGEAARYILGRIAGIDESRLKVLVRAKQVDVIVNALPGKRPAP
jgi:hypothetical protein